MLTRLRHRAQAARASGDAGVTLTELIVAMTLSTILGAMTLMVFLNVDKATSATTDRTINTSSARNAIQAWTSYLRVSDGPTAGSAVNRFEWITAGDIMFHANLYNRATSGAGLGSTTPSTMVWLRLDSAGALVEEQFPNTAAQGTNPSICRILVAKATAGGIATRLFTASDSLGYPLTGQNLGAATVVAAGCKPLPVTVPSLTNHPDPVAVANLQTVGSIAIDFTVSDSKGAHPLEFNSVATLPVLGGAL